MEREEKALDSLLRGVDKYYEHYDEAKRLEISEDLDFAFNQIQSALLQRYGITLDQAKQMNELDNYEYVQKINSYVESISD